MATINGTIDNDIINSGIGNDTVYGNTGVDTIYGNDGNDLIIGEQLSLNLIMDNSVPANTIMDTIPVFSGDNLYGDAGNDTIYGDLGNLKIEAVAGASVSAMFTSGVNLTFGNDTISGGTGNDLLVGDVNNVLLLAMAGTGDTDQARAFLAKVQINSGNDILDGGDGNDTIFGDVQTMRMEADGGTANDSRADARVPQNNIHFGADTITGGSGNDFLVGDVGQLDLIAKGGLGIDSLAIAGIQPRDEFSGNSFVFGNDNISGDGGNDTLIGDVNTLNINAQGGTAENGNATSQIFTMDISFGNDTLNGGDGNDVLIGDIKTLNMNAQAGTVENGSAIGHIFTMDISFGNDTLAGGDGNDVLVGDVQTANLTSTGGYGADSAFEDIRFKFGSDSLSGGIGNDTLVGDVTTLNISAKSTSWTWAWFDWNTFTFGNDTIMGQSGDDYLVGDVQHLNINLDAGNASLVPFWNNCFLFGNDTLNGGDGNDTLIGDVADFRMTLHKPDMGETVYRGGNDILIGGAGDDKLYGDQLPSNLPTLSQLLTGGTMNYEVFNWSDHTFDKMPLTATTMDPLLNSVGLGTTSNFTSATDLALNFGATLDQETFAIRLTGTMHFNSDVDLNFYTRSDDGSQLFIDLNNDGDFTDPGELVVNNDGLHGNVPTTGAVHLTAGDHNIAVTFYEQGGGQALSFGVWDPQITGGNDVLQGGTGNDLLDGGGGNDTADYSDATSVVTVNLSITGPQNVGGGLGQDTLVSIENLIGSKYNDTLTGDANNNILTGGKGNDVLNGGAGIDTIHVSGSSNEYSYAFDGNGHLSQISDIIAGRDGTDTTSSIEAIQFGNDPASYVILAGSSGNDIFLPADPHSLFLGGNGTDTVSYINATSGVTGTLANANIFAHLTDLHVKVYDIGGDGDYNIPANYNTGNVLEDKPVTEFGLSQLNEHDHFTAEYTGTLHVDSAGTYSFSDFSDDQSLVYIDNNLILDANWYKPTQVNSVDLGAGDHTIKVIWSQGEGGVALDLNMLGMPLKIGETHGSDLYSSIENLTGSSHGDTLVGDNGDNIIMGGSGSDALYGGDGNDHLYGETTITSDFTAIPTSLSEALTGGTMNYQVFDWSNNTFSNMPLTPTTVDPLLTSVGSGTTSNFTSTTDLALNFTQTADQESFAIRLTGTMHFDSDVDLTFYTQSDDGSQLFIDSNLVVNNDGLHGNDYHTGNVHLTAGNHDIAVTYYEQGGGQALSFGISTSDTMLFNDTLVGGNGNDFLDGGTGNDILIGGAGNDAFAFDLSVNAGKDIIKDFNAADDYLAFHSVASVSTVLAQAVITNDGTGHALATFSASGGHGGSIDFTNVVYTGPSQTLADIVAPGHITII